MVCEDPAQLRVMYPSPTGCRGCGQPQGRGEWGRVPEPDWNREGFGKSEITRNYGKSTLACLGEYVLGPERLMSNVLTQKAWQGKSHWSVTPVPENITYTFGNTFFASRDSLSMASFSELCRNFAYMLYFHKDSSWMLILDRWKSIDFLQKAWGEIHKTFVY